MLVGLSILLKCVIGNCLNYFSKCTILVCERKVCRLVYLYILINNLEVWLRLRTWF
jgi:hypothetical protein